MDSVWILAILFLAWWYFPIVGGLSETFSNGYYLFSRFKYLIPIVVICLLCLRQNSLSTVEQYVPVQNIIKTVFSDEPYIPQGRRFTTANQQNTRRILGTNSSDGGRFQRFNNRLVSVAPLKRHQAKRLVIQRLSAGQGHRCGQCAKPLANNYRLNYLIPPSQGGRASLENLQLVCLNC